MNTHFAKLEERMGRIYQDLIITSNNMELESLKQSFEYKSNIIKSYLQEVSQHLHGDLSIKYYDEMLKIQNDHITLSESIDDKIMLFIVGNGNVGKSTLINTLVGYQVAEVNAIPTTWKIDVYAPQNSTNKAIIKYNKSPQKAVSIGEAQRLVNIEEENSKMNKTYKSQLNEKKRSMKTATEREEITRYFNENIFYKSDITEVIWPVKMNWLLEKCHLVDTPGLNQMIDYNVNKKDIRHYYNSADAILWLLDGQTISAANSNQAILELEDTLSVVGGVRRNIIGVVNRIDMVRNSGGEEAVTNVMKDAVTIYGKKFTEITSISAKMSFLGITSNDERLINESGIQTLKSHISNLFITKAEEIKKSAKNQQNDLIHQQSEKIINGFLETMDYLKTTLHKKEKDLRKSAKDCRCATQEMVSEFYKIYLDDVFERTGTYYNELSSGSGIDVVFNKIYRTKELEQNITSLTKEISDEIKKMQMKMIKSARISEFKSISEETLGEYALVPPKTTSPSIFEIDIFKKFGIGGLEKELGIWGKLFLYFNKSGTRNNLKNQMKTQCDKQMKEIFDLTDKQIDSILYNTQYSLQKAFTEMLGNIQDIPKVEIETRELIKSLKVQITELDYKQILIER